MKEIWKELFERNTSIRFVKVLRVSIASFLAIVIAGLLGLKYSPTAGIIAFLSTQNTLRETHIDIITRCMAYALSVFISYIIFSLLGYNPYAFGLFMLIMVTICYYLGWGSVISTSIVVCTHFLTEGHFGTFLIWNEFLLLLIGTGSTMLLNKMLSNNTKEILQDIRHIENQLQHAFEQLAAYTLSNDKTSPDMSQLEELHLHLEKSYERAIENRDNTYRDDTNYYISYMNTRIDQYHTLMRIVENIRQMNFPSFMAAELSDFLLELSKSVHCRKNMHVYLEKHKILEKHFDNYPIPTNRLEFYELSHTHDILVELEYYIQLKIDFIESLSCLQLNRYWKENE